MGWARAGIILLLILTLYPMQGRGQGGASSVEWVASDGGGVETGGHVTVKGLPPNMIFGGTYTVAFSFVVEWFDGGSSLRPQRIEWYAKAGCLEETSGVCVRNSQNITLGSSTIQGSFSKNQTFSVTASLSLKNQPSTNGTVAALGVRMAAVVECLDSSLCAPVGAVNPAQKFTFLRPESSVSFTIFSTSISTNIIKNSGFEGGLDPITAYPRDWTNWTKHGGTGFSITVNSTDPQEGYYSARLEIGQLPIGFIALKQNLANTLFSNLTDRTDGLDFWFALDPKYSGMGDFRVRILFGENVGELNYVIDADPLLSYPNSTATTADGKDGGVKSLLLSSSSFPTVGRWHHFQKDLRTDWAAPLYISNSTFQGFVRGFSLDIPFLTIQFDALAWRNGDSYYSETAWIDDVKVYENIGQPEPTPVLLADFTIVPDFVAPFTPVTFNATVAGGTAPYTLSWDFGDGSTGTGNSIVHTYSYGGLFTVSLTVTDSNGVQMSTSQTVQVAPVCACFLDFTYDPLFPAPGQPVSFTATLVGGVPPYTFTWYFGDNSSTVGGVVIHVFPVAGDFQVRLVATDSHNPPAVLSTVHILMVQSVNLSPVADFIFSPVAPHGGQVVSFDGSSSYDPDGNITSWEWSFGDVICIPQPCFPGQTGPFVQHTYSGPANYTVTLAVTDNSGARTAASQIIHVLPPFEHDVSVETIQVSPRTVIQGQQVGILLGLGNRGTQNETVRLVVLWDSTTITDRTIVLRPLFNDPFGGITVVQWDTSNVPPGNHTISATVYLDSDQNMSNNSLTYGTVTILPPPTITLTPSNGTLGAKVVVTGTGFQIPEYGPTVQVFVSFDDQFLGLAFPRNGSFSFTFDVPHSEPGTHKVKAFDTYSLINTTADFQVLETPAVPELALSVESGTIYFPGDTATIYVHVTVNGAPVNSEGFTLQLTLYKPDGTMVVLNTTLVEAGQYRAYFQVPPTASTGTYAVVARASQSASQSSSALASFEVKPSWISQQGPKIAGATAAIAGIAAATVAWRKGYFRRKGDCESDVSV